MAVTVTHAKVATLPDEPGAEVNKAEWNDNHVVTGLGTAAEAATTDFDAAGVAAAGDTAHIAAGDPHIQYQKESEKDAVSGYAGVDADVAVLRAKALRETSGPTNLVVGAVADGQVLTRSGATIVGTTPGAGSTNIKATTVTVATPAKEAFFTVTDGDVTGASQIMVGWGNCAQSDANHPGMGEVGFNAVPGTGQLTAELYSLDQSNLFGDFKLNYLTG
jgi:hypothetical protein